MPGASEVGFASAHILCHIHSEDKGDTEFYVFSSSYEIARAVGSDQYNYRTTARARGPLEGTVHLRFGLTSEVMTKARELADITESAQPNTIKLTYNSGDGTAIGEIEFKGHIRRVRLVTGVDDGDHVEVELVVLSDPELGNLQQSIQA